MDDSFEILFETSSEDTTFKAIRSCILYKNGILRMSHIYENSNKDKTSFYCFKDNQYYVIDEIGKVLTEYQDLINSLPDFIENPYKTSSEKNTFVWAKSNFRIWSF